MTEPKGLGDQPTSTLLTEDQASAASPAKKSPRKRAPRKTAPKKTAGPSVADQQAALEKPVAVLEAPAPAPAVIKEEAAAPESASGQKKPTRRGRRSSRGRSRPEAPSETSEKDGNQTVQPALAVAPEQAPAEPAPSAPETPAKPEEGATPHKRTRRGRRSKKGQSAAAAPQGEALPAADLPAPVEPDDADIEKTEDKKDAKERDDRKKGAVKGAAKSAPKDAADGGKSPKSGPQPKRRMFMSVLPGEQVEVVLAENGRVTEYYVEMAHQAKTKSNIYKGVINNVDANLQAAFVNYGAEKNGFLQIDEVHPEYYIQPHDENKGKKYPLIQKALKAGQEVLVQVVKEPSGSKGAFLTTYLSLAGRFLVLTPGKEQIGVSRKVEDEEERARLREMLNGINPGPGLGLIMRTVSAGTSKTTVQRDLQFLKRLWKDVRKRGMEEKAPAIIHREPALATRAVRDYLSDEIQEVWVDDQATAEHILEYSNLLFPRKTSLVNVHRDENQSLWERFGMQKQIEEIYAREVTLPSGGRIVFDQTEALMAIDINSGKISGKTNFESMALRTNMEAAEAIALHLKLRDIGGQIVIDFIEMRDPNHVREVEKTLRGAMKNDRARHDVGKISRFGLMEVVRQRTAFSALSISMEPCPHCKGLGSRRNMEWQAQRALRELRRQLRVSQEKGDVHIFRAEPELALYLLNHKRERLLELEQANGLRIEVRAEGGAQK